MALTEVDRTLIKRCLTEDAGAWKDFVDRFIGLFIHVVRHTAHSRSVNLQPEDSEDLVADIFCSICANDYAVLRAFRGQSALATYLTVIARRVVIREMTRKRMAEALGHVSAHKTSLEQASASAEVPIVRLEDEEEVKHLLRLLPPRDARVVEAFHLKGQSYREISESTGLPENSIGPTLSRAMNRLRELRLRTV